MCFSVLFLKFCQIQSEIAVWGLSLDNIGTYMAPSLPLVGTKIFVKIAGRYKHFNVKWFALPPRHHYNWDIRRKLDFVQSHVGYLPTVHL